MGEIRIDRGYRVGISNNKGRDIFIQNRGGEGGLGEKWRRGSLQSKGLWVSGGGVWSVKR